ncbi:TonB family protein [Durusdinium trenchii]|uniref:TonB family protein n=1 Tax=Durusdinium trenchii TaxID=1381693 RepID=A0ABP0LJD7_9DINO
MAQEKAAEIIDLSVSRGAANANQSAAEFLAATRAAAGLSLAAVSDATKVKIEHLEAIEASDANALPITAYAVGFVKAYARFLGLDEEALAQQFKKDIGADQPAPVVDVPAASFNEGATLHEGARMASIFGIIAILVFMFWIVLQITAGPGGEEANRAASAPEERVRLSAAPLQMPTPRPRTDVDVAPLVTGGAVQADQNASPSAPSVTDAPADADEPVVESAEPVNEVPVSVSEAPVEEEIADVSAAVEPDLEVVPPLQSVPARPQPSLEPVRQQQAPATVIIEARLSRSIAPQYPNRCARRAEDLERVTVIFDVTENGRPANIRVADTTNDCFNTVAVSTLKRWRFEPKTIDGAPRPDIGKQATLNFRR